MIRRSLFALMALVLAALPAGAQNLICPTPATSSNNNQCASTAFVQNVLALGVPIVIGTTAIAGGVNGEVLYDNAGIAGLYTPAQLTAQINLATASLSGALPAWPNNTTTYFRGDGTYDAHNCASNTDAGTACTANTGTSGATVPINNAGFTQSGAVNFTSTFEISSTTEHFPASGNLVGTTDAQTLTNKTIAFGSNTLTGVAPTASPTFTGTVTMPDSSTWTSGGINAAIIGATTPAAATVTTLTTNNNSTGTIGGALCATSGGLLLYESGVNCFAASAGTITVGTTNVAGGTSPQLLYNNAGVLGNETAASAISGVTLTGGINLGSQTLSGTGTFSGTDNFTGTFQVSGNAMTFPAAAATLTQTIASGALALATGAIASGACTSAQTATATGTATTDVIAATFNADPTGVTGYAPTITGMLTIISYPTANTVNFKVCNNTAASITPGAVTLNWRVTR